jgi:hypothetical protein
MHRTMHFAIGSLAFAAACSSSPSPEPAPTGVVCPDIAVAPPQLAYPIPNATGVPTAAAYLVFYGTLPNKYAGTLTSGSGSSLVLGAFGAPPSPLPSPLAPPGTGPGLGGPPSGVAYPQLAAATKYTISFSDTGSCAMTVTSSSYAFTTR